MGRNGAAWAGFRTKDNWWTFWDGMMRQIGIGTEVTIVRLRIGSTGEELQEIREFVKKYEDATKEVIESEESAKLGKEMIIALTESIRLT